MCWGWAIRKGSPQLMEALNTFGKGHKIGTEFGNIMLRRYFRSSERILNATSEAEMRKFKALVGLFEKHAGTYEFDHLLLTLQETLGISVFMVTHDLDSLHRTCDRIAVLGDGKIIEAGNMDVMMASQHPWLRAYFHGERSHSDFQIAVKG